MDKVMLTLKKREVTGKQVKRLRREGMVPAVIHDHGKDSVVVMGPYLDVSKMYQKAGKNHPVTIKADDKQYTALVKHVTFDPKKNVLTHVVFNAVKANEKVSAEVPVRIKLDEDNDATPAERAGLVVLNQLEMVEVEAFPRDLPEALYFDGEKLIEAGDTVTVADLIVPADVVVKAEPNHPVATAFEPSALQAANDAAAGDAEEETPASEDQAETADDNEPGATSDEASADEAKEK